MRVGKELVGKPIFSITDGQDLGSVKDLYLDTELGGLKGIHLGSEGLFSRKSLVVTRENIAVIGVDAILTVGSDVITDSNEFPDVKSWLRREDIQGRAVETPGGTKVGTVGDIFLDHDGNVLGFALSRVFVEGPVKESKMILQEAVVETGGASGTMKVDLATVEGHAGGMTKKDETAETQDLGEGEEVDEPVEISDVSDPSKAGDIPQPEDESDVLQSTEDPEESE